MSTKRTFPAIVLALANASCGQAIGKIAGKRQEAAMINDDRIARPVEGGDADQSWHVVKAVKADQPQVAKKH